jgi:SNF2 family DNA or RNA helicase
MEPCSNIGTELQAVNRVHRLGQTKPVTIVTFAARVGLGRILALHHRSSALYQIH